MTYLTESAFEEITLEYMGCQRITCGKTDTCTARRRKCERILTLTGEVPVKDIEEILYG
jgi:hypothetical protein